MKILLADDHQDALETLAGIFQLENHRVFTAADGLAALALARQCKPDAVVLDLNMPDMAQSRAAGFDRPFTKPADPGELLECLTKR